MKLIKILALSAALGLAVLGNPVHAQPLTPADVWKAPAFRSPTVSPDGKSIAAIAPVAEKSNLVVLNLETRKVQAITSFNDFDVIEFHWVGSGRLVFTLGNINSPTGPGQFDGGGLFAVNKDGTGGKELSPTIKQVRSENRYVYRGYSYVRSVPGSEEEIVASSNKRDQHSEDLYQLNTKTGKATLLSVDRPPRVHSWLLDDKLVPRIAHEHIKDTNTSVVHYRKDAQSPWVEIARTDSTRSPVFDPLAFDNDGKTLQVATNKFGSTVEIYRFDPQTKQFGEKLASHPKYDMGVDANGSSVPGVSVHPVTGKVMGYAVNGDKPERVWVDADSDRIQRSLDNALPDTINSFRRMGGDDKLMIVTSYSDVKPAQWFIYDDGKKTLTDLFSSRPWLEGGKLTKMQPFTYKTRDGLEIPGYYFLPKDYKPGTKLPTIVHIHGGPSARADSWGRMGFGEREAQLFASHGYAVIVPNFRITPGMGNKVYYSGFGTIGRQMSEDHEDALKWGIEKGFVDPAKACMSGASYGGYATLQALIKSSHLFKCGVAGLVVADLELQLTSPSTDFASSRAALDFWKAIIGVKDFGEKIVADVSPAKNADKLKGALFIYAGLDDVRTPIEQTNAMIRALERAGNPPKDVFIAKNEGHGFGKLANNVELYTKVLKFLDAQIGPGSK